MKILVGFFLSISFFSSFINQSFANVFSDLIGGDKIIYCKGDSCSLSGGVDLVKTELKVQTEVSASVYIQQIVVYLLSFITILAVFYVIYAGFRILISAGDEESVTKSKTTIISVLIGIMIIWLSYAIVSWGITLVGIG